MRVLLRPLKTAPLFVQVLAILLVGLVAAQLLTAAVVVLMAPPAPDMFRASEIAAVLQGGRPSDKLTVSTGLVPPQGRPWAPGARGGPIINALAARELAVLLQVEPERVRVIDTRPPPLFDPMIRLDRFKRPGGPAGPHGPWGEGGPRPPRELVMFGAFKAALERPDGSWLTVQPRRNGAASLWRGRMLVWLVACVALLSPLAYLFAKRLTSPITAFARAAERLGRDPRAPALDLEGPAEVRTAVAAFNQMQERLGRYVDDRTAMIGAVAHDLRTPLTRMRFLLEARPEDVQDKMVREIDEMDAMIAATMAFVKNASAHGERVVLDIGALVESLAADLAETGAAVICDAGPPILVRGDPLALRRLFGNLLANAVKFAGGAEVVVTQSGALATITVADRGPGLPPSDLDRAFEPFFRIEASRNRETGGIGLGLAVVRSVARAHGGDAVLTNRPGGGLCCTVQIPLGT